MPVTELNQLVRCPARVVRGDTSAIRVFARAGYPNDTDSIPVRVFAVNRGAQLPLPHAAVGEPSAFVRPVAEVRAAWTDDSGLARLRFTRSDTTALVVRALGFIALRAPLSDALAHLDSVHVFLQVDAQAVCWAQENIRPGSS